MHGKPLHNKGIFNQVLGMILMRYFLFGLLGSALFLQGCTALGVATTAGATAGIAVAQEGGARRAWNDGVIQARINELWLRHDATMFRKLDLTVNQGRVLITGVVQDPEHRVEAVRLAWKPPGVEQVINEIRVAESEGIMGFARDNWAATRLRTAITLDRDVQSINYNIDVVQGIVYLMGVAQSKAELNRVIETARTIPDIKQVVSYVKLAGIQPQDFDPAKYEEAEGQNFNEDQGDQTRTDSTVTVGTIEEEPLGDNRTNSYQTDVNNDEPMRWNY